MSSENNLEIIDKQLVKISGIVLAIIGVTGNSLVFYILTRPKFLKESIFRFFIISEIAASLLLIMACVYGIPTLFKLDVPPIFCKIFLFFMYILYDFYPWVSVMNSIDRFLNLKYTTNFKLFKKFKIQALIAISIFFMLMIFNIPRIVYGTKSNVSLCAINNNLAGFYMNLFNLIISDIIPFFIMICSTFLIFHYLITQKKKLQENVANFRREKQFIQSVLAMDLWFLICYSPFCFLQLYRFSVQFDDSASLNQLLNDITIVLATIEVSCNFFVYFLCNKLFRSYFLSMIGCSRNTKSKDSSNGKGSTNIVKPAANLSLQNMNLFQLQ